MRSTWKSLLWKEWHEHKWKLASLTAVILAVPAILIATVPAGTTEVFHLLSATIACYLFLSGMFVGMSTAAGETTHGTMPFLQSLPVPGWQPAAAKMIVALLTVALPVAILMVTVSLITTWFVADPASLSELAASSQGAPTWGIDNWYLSSLAFGVCGAASLLLWMAAAGVNRSDEIRAGAIGFLVIALVWIAGVYAGYLAHKHDLPTVFSCLQTVAAALPGGPAMVNRQQLAHDVPWGYVPFVSFAVLGHGGVLAWYLTRFGRVAPQPSHVGPRRIVRTPSVALHRPPRRSQLAAIVWKQLCETGPLVLLAMAADLCITAAYFGSSREDRYARPLGEVLCGVTYATVFLVTIAVGIGVFLEDLHPKVNAFWRSRPVNLRAWFLVKSLSGFVVLALGLGSLMLAALLLGYWDEVYSTHEPAALIVFVFTLGWLALYAVAMLSYVLVRQAVYAAVLSLFLYVAGAFGYASLNYYWELRFPGFLAFMLVCIAVPTVLAYQALKHDWGWKLQGRR